VAPFAPVASLVRPLVHIDPLGPRWVAARQRSSLVKYPHTGLNRLVVMLSYETSTVARAVADAAWAVWTDVEGWSRYDHIEDARIDGVFQPGAVITSKRRASHAAP
jgi:hypothetical protein